MTTIALFGAGGKMGVRLAKNLVGSAYEVRHVEPGAAGRQRLKDQTGLDCVAAEVALKGAERLSRYERSEAQEVLRVTAMLLGFGRKR